MPYKDPRVQREFQRRWIRDRRQEFFKDKKCELCGATQDKRPLELDHIDPSTKIDHKIWSWSEDRRNEELEKCRVLCYFCHQNVTAKEWEKRRKHNKTTYKNAGCRCSKCKRAWAEYKRKHSRRGGTADSLLLKSNSPSGSVGANPTGGTNDK